MANEVAPPLLVRMPAPPDRSRFRRRAARPGGDDRFYALIRDIGAEARDLLSSLDSATTALAIADASARERAMTQELAEVDRTRAAAFTVVKDRSAELDAILHNYAAVYDRYGDEIQTIDNLWNRSLAELPRQYKAAEHAAVQAQVAAASQTLSELIWHVALVTIPPRLDQHLATISVGGRLDFAATFSDELPDPKRRQRLLEYLAAHPRSVAGVVDQASGIIYKSATSLRRRLASYLLIFVLAVPAGVLFVKLLTDGIPAIGLGAGWLGIAANRTSELATAYAFLLVGSLFHIGVEAIKQDRKSSSGSFTAIGDWLAWIHVRELPISAGIVVVWLTLAGLAISQPANQFTWQMALFAGYSIDSIFGLFVARFDTLASGMLEKMTPAITGTPADTTGTP